jgi:adenine-specific DNA-methyltransferase
MTELIWDGKYKDGAKQGPVRIVLPFQTIETVNESTQERQRSLELFSAGREPDWRNRLIWGDKKYVLPSLLPDCAGRANLIYIDPPFDTGSDFSFTAFIPEDPTASDEEQLTPFTKEPSIIEQKAYRDTWGRGPALDSYLQWFYETVVHLWELLHETGSLYVHLDAHVAHYAKAVLDEVFGADNFRNEIIWKRASTVKGNFGQGSKLWSPNTENLFFYTKTDSYNFRPTFVPYTDEYLETFFRYQDERGRRYRLISMIGPGGEAKGNPIYEVMGVKRAWRYSKSAMDELIAGGLVVQTQAWGCSAKKAIPRRRKGCSSSNPLG